MRRALLLSLSPPLLFVIATPAAAAPVTADAPVARQVQVETRSATFRTLAGQGCAARASAPGSVTITLPALGYAVCAAGESK